MSPYNLEPHYKDGSDDESDTENGTEFVSEGEAVEEKQSVSHETDDDDGDSDGESSDDGSNHGNDGLTVFVLDRKHRSYTNDEYHLWGCPLIKSKKVNGMLLVKARSLGRRCARRVTTKKEKCMCITLSQFYDNLE